MPRSRESSIIPTQGPRSLINGLIGALGSPRQIARLAGLAPKSNESKALVRSLERFREDKPKQGKQASSKMSEKNLSLLEKAAAAAGKTASVTVEAKLSRREGEPAVWRQFTQEVPAADLLRHPATAVVEAAPIPPNYYAAEEPLDDDTDTWDDMDEEELDELEANIAEAVEIQKIRWER